MRDLCGGEWVIACWRKKSHETFLKEKILGQYCVGLLGNEPPSEYSATLHQDVSYLYFVILAKDKKWNRTNFGLYLKSLSWVDLGFTTFANAPINLGFVVKCVQLQSSAFQGGFTGLLPPPYFIYNREVWLPYIPDLFGVRTIWPGTQEHIV